METEPMFKLAKGARSMRSRGGLFLIEDGLGSLAITTQSGKCRLKNFRSAEFVRGEHVAFITDMEQDMLKAHFEAQRDEELGRWRWPEGSNYLVYEVGPGVVDVLRETHPSKHESGPGVWSGIKRTAVNSSNINGESSMFYQAAKAYFEMRELAEPWKTATNGEVWELTVEGKVSVFKLFGDLFRTGNLHDIERADKHITAGRRVWPAE